MIGEKKTFDKLGSGKLSILTFKEHTKQRKTKLDSTP